MPPPADAHAPFNAGQSGEALAAGVGAPPEALGLEVPPTFLPAPIEIDLS